MPLRIRIISMFFDLIHAWRYASTLPTRLTLAISSALWSLFLVHRILAPVYNFDSPRLGLLCEVMPLGDWAAVFGLVSFCQWWRLLDFRPRPRWARFTNYLTFGLWSGVTITAMMQSQAMSAPASSDLALAVMSFWVALRTELTPNDRQTA